MSAEAKSKINLNKEELLKLDITTYNMAMELQWKKDKVKKNLSGDLNVCIHCLRKYSICCICDKAEKRWKEVIDEVREVSEQRARDERSSEPSEISLHLLKHGFHKYAGERDYDCVLRIHELHYLFWSDNLKHFSLGVMNSSGKGLAGGGFKRFNRIIIPRPIYTIQHAEEVVTAITDQSYFKK